MHSEALRFHRTNIRLMKDDDSPAAKVPGEQRNDRNVAALSIMSPVVTIVQVSSSSYPVSNNMKFPSPAGVQQQGQDSGSGASLRHLVAGDRACEKKVYVKNRKLNLKKFFLNQKHFKSVANDEVQVNPIFSCFKCEKMFNLLCKLKNHLQIHEATLDRHCCQEVLSSKYDFNNHKKRVHHTYTTRWKCQYSSCDMIFNEHYELTQHMEFEHFGFIRHPSFEYKCSGCSSVFTKRKQARNHSSKCPDLSKGKFHAVPPDKHLCSLSDTNQGQPAVSISHDMSGYPGAAYPGARPPGQGYPSAGAPPGQGYPGAPGAPPPGQSYNRPGAPTQGQGYSGAPQQQGYPGAGAPPRPQGYPGAGAPPGQQGYGGAPPQQGYGSGAAPQGYAGQQQQQQGYGGAAPPPQQGGGYGGGPPVDAQVQQWFNVVEQDRSGQIDSKELQRALVNGNWSPFSEEACRMMIDMFDRDKTGQINVQALKEKMEASQQPGVRYTGRSGWGKLCRFGLFGGAEHDVLKCSESVCREIVSELIWKVFEDIYEFEKEVQIRPLKRKTVPDSVDENEFPIHLAGSKMKIRRVSDAVMEEKYLGDNSNDDFLLSPEEMAEEIKVEHVLDEVLGEEEGNNEGNPRYLILPFLSHG